MIYLTIYYDMEKLFLHVEIQVPRGVCVCVVGESGDGVYRFLAIRCPCFVYIWNAFCTRTFAPSKRTRDVGTLKKNKYIYIYIKIRHRQRRGEGTLCTACYYIFAERPYIDMKCVIYQLLALSAQIITHKGDWSDESFMNGAARNVAPSPAAFSAALCRRSVPTLINVQKPRGHGSGGCRTGAVGFSPLS